MFLTLVLLGGSSLELQAQATRPVGMTRRIVKHFDFNERAAGNFESTPMYWRRRADPGVSLYLEGSFDAEIYHSGAPSFRLDLDGGSVGYEYLGGDVVIHKQANYMVTGWIRTRGLDTARAYMSACYLDRKRSLIPGTERRSVLIGGRGTDTEWQPITISLPGDQPGARYITASVWLSQERIWNDGPRSPHAVDQEDIKGSAWFDDITIFPCPAVSLSSGSPRQAFTDAPELRVEITNPNREGLSLSAGLTLFDVAGRTVRADDIGLEKTEPTSARKVTYADLPTGAYRAELIVNTDNLPLIRREITFLRLPAHVSPPPLIGRGFGFILENTDLALLEAQMGLLRDLGPQFVKMSMPSVPTDDANLAAGSPGERYRQAIVENHSEPIVILASPQTQPASNTQEVNAAAQRGDYVEIPLAANIPVESIAGQLTPLVSERRQQVWIMVEAPPIDAYEREIRRIDLARRLVEAVWQESAAVFLKVPWSTRMDGEVSRLVPDEDFLTVQTAVDVLGGATPVSRFELDGRARVILFDRGGKSVAFVWDPHAPPAGKDYILPLGEDVRQVDLCGGPLAVGRAGQQRVVRIGPVPTYIVDAPTWILDFRRHITLTPQVLQSSLEPAEPVIRFRNTSAQPIAGVLRLLGPPGWELGVSRLPFAIQPGQEFSQRLEMRIPQSAPAEMTPLVAEFELIADQHYHFMVPAWFELGLKGIDLDTSTRQAGDSIIISLQATNRTDRNIQFDADLLAPNRNRVARQLAGFPPNQTMTETFQIEGCSALEGQCVRLTLKERNGSRAWNQVFVIPPRRPSLSQN